MRWAYAVKRRNLMIVGAAVVALGSLAWAAGVVPAKRPTGPHIEVSRSLIDFGRLRPLQEVEATVTIENRGGQALHLEEPVATCGCQKPTLDRRGLGPGERAVLTLRQQARPEGGPFQHMVMLKSNDPEIPEATIYLRGTVSRGLTVRPEPLTFGAMTPGESAVRFLEIASDEGKPSRLMHHQAGGGMQVNAPIDVPAMMHRIEVTLKAGQRYGPIREQVLFNTDMPDSPPLFVEVTGEVSGPVRVTPAALTLGSVPGLSQVSRKLILTGLRGPIRLERITAHDESWLVTYEAHGPADGGPSQVVDLTIRVPDSPGLIDGMLSSWT